MSKLKDKEPTTVVLGSRYKCYKCNVKFYDLGRPLPLCPLCGANQNDDESRGLSRRKRRRRPSTLERTAHTITAPKGKDSLSEVVSEVDEEYVVDMNDLAPEEIAE